MKTNDLKELSPLEKIISGIQSYAQQMAKGWPAARSAFWKKYGVNGEAPKRLVQMRNNKTGEVKIFKETQELHHIDPIHNDGTNALNNLTPLWPTQHALIDPHRYPGYTLLRVLKNIN